MFLVFAHGPPLAYASTAHRILLIYPYPFLCTLALLKLQRLNRLISQAVPVISNYVINRAKLTLILRAYRQYRKEVYYYTIKDQIDVLNTLLISQQVNNILFSFGRDIFSKALKFRFKPLTLTSSIFTSKYIIKVKALFTR